MLDSGTWVLTVDGPRRLRDLAGDTATLITADTGTVEVAVGAPRTGAALEAVTVELNGGVTVTASTAARLADGPVTSAPPQPQRHYRTRLAPLPETVRRGRRVRPEQLADTSTTTSDLRATLAASPHAKPVAGLYLPGVPEWPGRGDNDDGYLIGHFIGDGTFARSAAELDVWDTGAGVDAVRARLVTATARFGARSDWKGFRDVTGRHKAVMRSAGLLEHVTSWDLYPKRKTLNDTILQGSSQFTASVISGLFDTDGHVEGNAEHSVSVRLSQADRTLLAKTQLLLAFLGIRSQIYTGRPSMRRMMPDGRGGHAEFDTQGFHRLTTTGLDAVNLMRTAPFVDTDKLEKFAALTADMVFYRKKHAARVTTVSSAGDAELVPVTPTNPGTVRTPWIGADGVVVDLFSLAAPKGTRRAHRSPRRAARGTGAAGPSTAHPTTAHAELTERILALRAKPMKVTEISLLVHLPPSRVRQLLEAAGQPERARGRKSDALVGPDLASEYETGATVHEIATRHQVSAPVARDALLRSGVTMRPFGTQSKTHALRTATDAHLHAQYASNGLRALAAEYGVSTTRLRNEFVERGIPTRPRGLRPTT